MKKNKKEKINLLQKSPNFLKNTFTYFILISIFTLCAFILMYRYINKFNERSDFVFQSSAPAPAPAPVSTSEFSLLQKEISFQNNRLDQLEAKLNQWKPVPQLSRQLISMEILQEVLEGHLPLSTFVLYLQKTSEPWAPPILKNISAIKESKTYAQLQASLVLLPPSHSLWRRVKNALKSFIRIRKLDAEEHYVEGHLDDISKALREHNIQQALEIFDKLSPKEQARLSLWEKEAKNRLTLETIKLKMLLDLAGAD